MQYSKNRILKLIDQYDTLLEHIDDYVRECFPDKRRGDVRIYYGYIEEYVNISCHCHPEYDWDDRGSVEDFIKWINTKGDKYKSKHYPKTSN